MGARRQGSGLLDRLVETPRLVSTLRDVHRYGESLGRYRRSFLRSNLFQAFSD